MTSIHGSGSSPGDPGFSFNPAVAVEASIERGRFGDAEVGLDRAIGALLGLAIGDAVGTTLEFQAHGTLVPRQCDLRNPAAPRTQPRDRSMHGV